MRSAWLSGPLTPDGIAVTVEPASAPEVLSLIAQTHELTAREGEVVRLVTQQRRQPGPDRRLHDGRTSSLSTAGASALAGRSPRPA